MKECRHCRTVKPLDAFDTSKDGLLGRASRCKDCRRVYNRAASYRTRRTAAEVDVMLEAQGGLCALCWERPAQHVDHDHLTGKVRGVLCSCCNQGLGNFRDRADVMRAAISYLETHSWQKRRVEPGVYELTAPRS